MCLFILFCTQEMLSTPPARTSPSPAMMRCAASAMVCRPLEQKRLIVRPLMVIGRPARSAIWRAMLAAGGALGVGAAHDHVLDSAGLDAGALDGRDGVPASVAPWVMLKGPSSSWPAARGRWRRSRRWSWAGLADFS